MIGIIRNRSVNTKRSDVTDFDEEAIDDDSVINSEFRTVKVGYYTGGFFHLFLPWYLISSFHIYRYGNYEEERFERRSDICADGVQELFIKCLCFSY